MWHPATVFIRDVRDPVLLTLVLFCSFVETNLPCHLGGLSCIPLFLLATPSPLSHGVSPLTPSLCSALSLIRTRASQAYSTTISKPKKSPQIVGTYPPSLLLLHLYAHTLSAACPTCSAQSPVRVSHDGFKAMLSLHL